MRLSKPGKSVSSCCAWGAEVRFHGVRGSTPCDGRAVRALRRQHLVRRRSSPTATTRSSSTWEPGCGRTATRSWRRARSSGSTARCCSATSTGTTSRACRSSARCRAPTRPSTCTVRARRRSARRGVRRGHVPAVLPDHARGAARHGALLRRRRRPLPRQRREGAVALGAPHEPDARVPARARGLLRSRTSPTTGPGAPTTPTTTCRQACSSSPTASTS